MPHLDRWLWMFAIVALALVEALAGRAAADVPAVLRISAIPDENPNELLRIYTSFADDLAKELGMKVHFTPVVDYAAAGAA